MLRQLVLTAVLAFEVVEGFSSKYLSCQMVNPSPASPLSGCPKGTVYVSATDGRARYQSVQEAVSAIGNKPGNAYILVGQGSYFGLVNVTRQWPLTILGEVVNSNSTNNAVEIWSNIAVKTGACYRKSSHIRHCDGINFLLPLNSGQDNAVTPALIVAPSWNASLIGSGPTGAPLQPLFGSPDFKAYNIDFNNRAANQSVGPALATDISYANASFYGCNFASWQDTWYTGRNGSTYVIGGTIYGQTDYLFGFGTAWFEKVTLANRACGGGITAWKGSNETDAPGNHYGVYVANSRIIRSPDANATTVTDRKCYLGRPWNDLATSVYINTTMDQSINLQGFTPWGGARPEIANTTFYAEYNSSGSGYDASKRLAAEHILGAVEVENFTVEQVFNGKPRWVDWSYKP
ncbi:Putative pectinesterase/pectinesterase inhibitor 26 [Rhizoctonia solani]|uniref:pectinesterase n=1 Tax=Rhizoctonia solani TaxID=456999 RepID=A0A0K6FY66_9AGAM|nr:Putative pectinesterase/pectinesterase inhibitor 26 [Rhizoctonia solani]